MQVVEEPSQAIRISYRCQVLVVGGGPAGFAAALASARNGADTVLLERYGTLGGMATLGMVSPMYGFWSGDTQVVRGIAQEVLDTLASYPNGTLGHQVIGKCPARCMGVDKCPTFGVKRVALVDTEILKLILPEMLEDAGARIILYTHAIAAIVEDNGIRVVIAQSGTSRFGILADIVIDSTGDGNIAASSGAPFEVGSSDDPMIVKPPSLIFTIGNVSLQEYRIVIDGDENVGRMLLLRRPTPGEYVVNASAPVGSFDPTSASSLTREHLAMSRQVRSKLEYLRRYVPGCENVRLTSIAPQIGVRDSRRILGDYVLNAEDVLADRKFLDGIAAGCHPLDLHVASSKLGGSTIVPRRCGDFYHIPYRCLLPRGLKNVLVSGRCISATFEAQGSIRLQATCMATGQAAGTAAALCVRNRVRPRDIPTELLRETLRSQDAVL